jgi:ABC-type Na+ transport system ATPase subunit NatA
LEQFSIGEILKYFGRLFGMTSEDVHHRSSVLTELLGLPESSRLISNLR